MKTYTEALITPYEIPEEYERLPPTEGPTVEILNLTEEVTDESVRFYEETLETIDALLAEYRVSE